MIYFVQEDGEGAVKIGYSECPIERLSALQTANSKKLHLLGVIQGDLHLESELQERFAEGRIRGEWFSPLPKLLHFIEIEGKQPLEALAVYWKKRATVAERKIELAQITLSDKELALVAWAIAENGGYLPLAAIEERGGFPRRAARKLAQDWQRRGWLVKDSDAKNKRRITEKLKRLIAIHDPNLPTPPRPSA